MNHANLKKDIRRNNNIEKIAQHFGLSVEECFHFCKIMEDKNLIVLNDKVTPNEVSITVFGKDILRNSSKLDKIFDDELEIEDTNEEDISDKPKGKYQQIGLIIGFIGLLISMYKC